MMGVMSGVVGIVVIIVVVVMVVVGLMGMVVQNTVNVRVSGDGTVLHLRVHTSVNHGNLVARLVAL